MARRPEPRVYFVDRNLGRGIVPALLRAAGATVEVHDDHFAQDTDDVAWLPEVGKRGWALLSKDKRIRRNDLEREALHQAGIAAFMLSSGNLSGEDAGKAFARALTHMDRALRLYVPPFIAQVHRDGKVVLPANVARRADQRRSR